MTTISPADLAALMGGATPHAVLDVRERAAFERGHIYWSTSLPRRLLETRLPGLVTAKATPIVLIDEDGTVAELARPTLAAMGHSDVRVLDGGLAAWRAAGRPLVQGLNVPSKVFGERALHEWKTPQLTCPELAERIARGDDMVIVDSRTPEEYHRGCIPGSVSMPGGELVLRIGELVKHPDQTIIVHCGGRTRSYIGAESLRRMGLPNPIIALENGTMGWLLAGLELERGAERWAPPITVKGRAVAAEVAKRVAESDGLRGINAAELKAMRARRDAETLYVFDVRTAEEYAAGHVAGAVWVPGGQAVQAIDDYLAVRGAQIVFVCDDGSRAALTTAWYKRLGFPRIAYLEGGLPAWQAAGGALETGHPAPEPWGLETARKAVATVAPDDLGGAVVVSVDPSDLYAKAHVPGAVWLCRSRLERMIGAVAPDKAQALVITCADGVQSTYAAVALARLGYGKACVLAGGVRAWQAAGRPIETGPTRLADETDDVVQKPYERGRAAMEAYLRWEEALDHEGRSPHTLLPGTPATR
ncbi:MAG TPA: rhodanese-like domain-containing protein [Methylomirabilota bacterium]|nr:rhodanese-like domain-containing protein [Methylomirabilota bacterium]